MRPASLCISFILKPAILWAACIPVLLFYSSCSRDNIDSVYPEEVNNSPINITSFATCNDGFIYTVSAGGESRIVKGKRQGMGVAVSIHDADDNLLFQVAAETDGHSLIIAERTEFDRLYVKLTETANEIEEHYKFNRDELIVAYPKLDEVTMANSYNLYQRGIYEDIQPELLEAFIEFENFYRMDNSLHWNSDADILLSTLFSDQFKEMASSKIANGSDAIDNLLQDETRKKSWFFDVYCATAGVVSGLKCFFGGPANIICDAAALTSIACALFELFTTYVPWS